MYVVDGQHRVLALRKAILDGWAEGADFLVPFICILGAEEYAEMKQFHEINSNAKSVRTDLALALLKQMSIEDPSIIDDLEGKKKAWQIDAQTITERMSNESEVWRGRIRLPAMEKGGTTMPSASMVKSLSPVLNAPFFKRLNEDQRLRILEAYWQAVREVIPEAFEDPENYTLMKGVGVRVLHNLLPVIVEAIRDEGKSTASSENYAEILKQPLIDVSAYNAHGHEVAGSDFWLSGAEGGAGSFSSESGIARLTAILLRLLPDSEI
jgi:DGQHR domain-containing protein